MKVLITGTMIIHGQYRSSSVVSKMFGSGANDDILKRSGSIFAGEVE